MLVGNLQVCVVKNHKAQGYHHLQSGDAFEMHVQVSARCPTTLQSGDECQPVKTKKHITKLKWPLLKHDMQVFILTSSALDPYILKFYKVRLNQQQNICNNWRDTYFGSGSKTGSKISSSLCWTKAGISHLTVPLSFSISSKSNWNSRGTVLCAGSECPPMLRAWLCGTQNLLTIKIA